MSYYGDPVRGKKTEEWRGEGEKGILFLLPHPLPFIRLLRRLGG